MQVARRNFDNTPWRHVALDFDFTGAAPGDVLWAALLRYHPFSVTVEPDEVQGWKGSLQVLVSNRVTIPHGTDYPTLGDQATGPMSVMYDAPFQWIGVQLITNDSGLISVHVVGSPYARNIQP